ncbi:MAG TPA: sigma-70 family RNA polymerase sigma factor [Solirubrobacteraceae bacterium]|nr:sigma-70 family RNA polymerase sigma factor [Solirubrobacteraceae bacterium]
MPPPFQRLLDEHGESVLRFLAASVGPVDADDCFQETVIAALRAYPRLRHSDNLRGWLLTIAHHKALDHHRARARRAVPVEDPDPGSADAAPARDDGLWDAVNGLPPKQRGAVLLRFVGDLSHREIAKALDSSEEAARRALADGLAKLRKEWTPA